VRFRSVVRALSVELFGESLALPDFPARRDLRGLGMSDWDGYAERLARVFDYTNTYYHREPRLDITRVPEALCSSFDFVVSSDVFEHVPPPVGLAFENARRLLKPGGVLVFTVPYTKEGRTVEHFPDLYDYRIAGTRRGHVLHNTTRAGERQTFRDLVFHGGAGQTLEMRVFSESSLIEEFARAGFGQVRIHGDADPAHGILWRGDWSLPVSARAGGARPGDGG
jgi:SAM-dependent methyltransferase